MNDPNVILRLTIKNLETDRMFGRLINKNHYVFYFFIGDNTRESFSRATTVLKGQEKEISNNYNSRLLWTFDHTVKYYSRFSFGSDLHRCDIVLPHRIISGLYFYITWDREKRRWPILYDVLRNGTSVSYNGKANYLRKHFRWIIFNDYTIEVTIKKLRTKTELLRF